MTRGRHATRTPRPVEPRLPHHSLPPPTPLPTATPCAAPALRATLYPPAALSSSEAGLFDPEAGRFAPGAIGGDFSATGAVLRWGREGTAGRGEYAWSPFTPGPGRKAPSPRGGPVRRPRGGPVCWHVRGLETCARSSRVECAVRGGRRDLGIPLKKRRKRPLLEQGRGGVERLLAARRARLRTRDFKK